MRFAADDAARRGGGKCSGVARLSGASAARSNENDEVRDRGGEEPGDAPVDERVGVCKCDVDENGDEPSGTADSFAAAAAAVLCCAAAGFDDDDDELRGEEDLDESAEECVELLVELCAPLGVPSAPDNASGE